MALFLHFSSIMKTHKRSKKWSRPLSPSMTHKKVNTLAVCMIVKNEEQCLPLILSDIEGLWDELIIVDTGSTDRTIEIAQNFGARVVSQAWTGDFSAARNRSKDEATAAWIMWLDADDRIEAADLKRLQSLKPTLHTDNVYNLQVVNRIADGFSPPLLQARLFPNDPRLRFESRVHESIMLSARKHGFRGGHLPVKVIHTGYATPEQLLTKMKRNMTILEQELADNPDAIMLRFLYANTLVHFKRFKEAQGHYERVITTPDARDTQGDIYHAALIAMAVTHNILMNFREAENWARRAAQDRPQGIQGWCHWGQALIHLNQNKAALEKLFRALTCKDLISTVMVDYSGLRIACLEAATAILVSLNRHQEAENLLRDALKKEAAPRISALLDKLQNKSGASEEELLHKGQELLDSKAYVEASRIFIQVIESNPQSFAAYNGLGLISWYSGKYDDAYVLFKKAAETGQVHEDILLNLWDTAQATDKIEDSRVVLEEILSRNPGMEKIKELLEKNT